jgi:hypothetical protein
MSWSVAAVGKASAVAAKLAKDIAASKCSEPEETVKNTVGTAIASALAGFPPNYAVEVMASGSQSKPDHTKEETTNQLSVTIKPLWGFVE